MNNDLWLGLGLANFIMKFVNNLPVAMAQNDLIDKLALLNNRISGVFDESSTTVKIGSEVKSNFGTGKVVKINDNGIAVALDKWESVGIENAPKLVVDVSSLTLKKSVSTTPSSNNNNKDKNHNES